MSIVNVVESPRRAVMLTDSSLYDATGTIIDFARKAVPVEGWNGVVSFRGNSWGLNAGLDIAECYASFDEFLARSAPEIERAYRAAAGAGELTAQAMVEIHVAGWSELHDCAKAFLLVAGAVEGWDHPEFVWLPLREVEPSGILTLPMSSRALWRLHRQGAEPGVDFTPETFDPMRHGLPLIEEQRRGKTDPRMGPAFAGKHVIGGELWLTVVDREGTRQQVVHEWPDAVGEPIQPAPLDESRLPKIVPTIADGWRFRDFEEALRTGLLDPETFEPRERVPAVAPGARMSRQERRAEKSKARKGLAHV